MALSVHIEFLLALAPAPPIKRWSKHSTKRKFFIMVVDVYFSLCPIAQWSERVTKPPWSSKQIEVNLTFLEASGYILSEKVFLYNSIA